MDHTPIYPAHSPDADSYQGSSAPSAPPIPNPQYVHYQTIPMPLPHQSEYAYRYAIRRNNTDGNHFPINASFFLLGLFFFPPLWFIGWCCWNSNDKYEKAWRKVNIFMSVFFIIFMIFAIVIFSILGFESIERGIPNEDPSWRIPPSLYLMKLLLY